MPQSPSTHLISCPREDGISRNMLLPQPLSYFRVLDAQDRAQSFTVDNHSETANFASYAIIEMGLNYLSEEEFFVPDPYAGADWSLQTLYARIKRGIEFTFAYDLSERQVGTLTAPVVPGSQEFPATITYDLSKKYRVTNRKGQWAIFRSVGGPPPGVLLYPLSPFYFEIGDDVTSWRFFPQLHYIGDPLNEGWDETGQYYSFHIRARTGTD